MQNHTQKHNKQTHKIIDKKQTKMHTEMQIKIHKNTKRKHTENTHIKTQTKKIKNQAQTSKKYTK